MSADALDVAGVAAELGYHPDTLRKHWRSWADPQHPDYVRFPPPFRAPPAGKKGRCWWRASAIAEWKLHRERALGSGASPQRPHFAGDFADLAARKAEPRGRAVAAQRENVLRLMERN